MIDGVVISSMAFYTIPKPPEWLAKRGGGISPGLRDYSLFILINGSPLYYLEARPAKGRFICVIEQTANGRRLDDGTIFSTPEEAIVGGIEQLRAHLGW